MLLGGVFLGACGGEEFASKPSGTGGGGTGGAAGASGNGGSVSGGAGGTAGGAGGTAGGAAGVGGTGTGGTTTGGAGGAPAGGAGGLPACSGGVCAPSVPGGWQGPVALIDTPGSTVAQCSGAYSSEKLLAHNQLVGGAPPAGCSCTCDAAGVACSNARIDAYVGPSSCTGAACCGGTACTTVPVQNGSCVNAGASLCASVTHAQVRVDTNKGCAPSVHTTLDNLTFNRSVRVCAPPSPASCATGTCVPSPGAPTDGRLCIYKDGGGSCPAPYTQKVTVWVTQDKRTCSGNCGCVAPTCGTIQFFGGQNCTGSSMGTPPVPMGCAAAAAGSGVQSAKYTPNATPSCNPYGTPTPAGELQQNEVTICCLPGGG